MIRDRIIRWTAHRRAEILDAIASGDITRDHAKASFNISEEELASWEAARATGGAEALSAGALLEARA